MSKLRKKWGEAGGHALTPRQFSFRLPVWVAARIYELEEKYPNVPRTHIVIDLITAGLETLDKEERG